MKRTFTFIVLSIVGFMYILMTLNWSKTIGFQDLIFIGGLDFNLYEGYGLSKLFITPIFMYVASLIFCLSEVIKSFLVDDKNYFSLVTYRYSSRRASLIQILKEVFLKSIVITFQYWFIFIVTAITITVIRGVNVSSTVWATILLIQPIKIFLWIYITASLVLFHSLKGNKKFMFHHGAFLILFLILVGFITPLQLATFTTSLSVNIKIIVVQCLISMILLLVFINQISKGDLYND